MVYGARAQFRMPVGERVISRGNRRDRGSDVKHIEVSHSSCWWFHLFALMVWDGAAWVVALTAGVFLRFELDVSQINIFGLEQLILVVLFAQLVTGTTLQVYSGRYCIGSVDDAINVSAAIALGGVIAFGFNLLQPTLIPRTVPLIAALVAVMLAVGMRLVVRRHRECRFRRHRASSQRVIVFGAGNEGQQLVRSMLSDSCNGYLPVALLDDDPDARRRRVSGVAVRGTHADIVAVAAVSRADLLIVANREADGKVVREIARSAMDAGLGVKVLPPLTELLRPWVGISDLRELDISDLLGRQPIEIDVTAIADYLSNVRVLVTGAGGSIGSELCRQIHRFGPAELLMLDRDESALHGTQLSIYGSALLTSSDVLLADIRDFAAIANIFMKHRPHVVFHAAALKHLPILEQYPDEAWKTNVIGTQNVLDAAILAGVDRFVNISTDKAANPISVLGRSKRIGERLVANAAKEATGTFLSVRFGNVLGSRGSVLTTFTEQLATGGPITVTHPEVARFFMTIPEAVQLVIYSAAIGRPGQALVLDMGSPVRIADVARQLMEIAGRSIEIVYTGLRVGEKLREELFGEGETDDRPIHPLISHVSVPGLDPTQVVDCAMKMGAAKAMINFTATPTDAKVAQHLVDQIVCRIDSTRWETV